MNWLDGKTDKRTVFDTVNLNNIDTEQVNQKRKELNIGTSIEEGAILAIEQAKEKAKRVAVVCHKSGYQYFGTGKDAKDFGKKTQQSE